MLVSSKDDESFDVWGSHLSQLYYKGSVPGPCSFVEPHVLEKEASASSQPGFASITLTSMELAGSLFTVCSNKWLSHLERATPTVEAPLHLAEAYIKHVFPAACLSMLVACPDASKPKTIFSSPHVPQGAGSSGNPFPCSWRPRVALSSFVVSKLPATFWEECHEHNCQVLLWARIIHFSIRSNGNLKIQLCNVKCFTDWLYMVPLCTLAVMRGSLVIPWAYSWHVPLGIGRKVWGRASSLHKSCPRFNPPLSGAWDENCLIYLFIY